VKIHEVYPGVQIEGISVFAVLLQHTAGRPHNPYLEINPMPALPTLMFSIGFPKTEVWDSGLLRSPCQTLPTVRDMTCRVPEIRQNRADPFHRTQFPDCQLPIYHDNRFVGLRLSSRKGRIMFTSWNWRRFLVIVAVAGCLSAGSTASAQEYCDDECVEECDTCPRPSLCFSIARHLKLQSVYFCRKVTRPYRRIADVPPELCPSVSPSLPPNAYTNPAAYGVGAHVPGWNGDFNPAAYPPPGGYARYNAVPGAGGYTATIGSPR